MAPVRVGGNIKPPQKLVDVKAVMPDVARAARVQGVVIVEVTIGVDGKVRDAKVLRSIPLLDQAALDAVRQWEFTVTDTQRRPGAGDHDGDGELHAGVAAAGSGSRTQADAVDEAATRPASCFGTPRRLPAICIATWSATR